MEKGEDDGRLKKCHELKIAVVPPDYIKACVSQHRIIPLELYAADEHETDDNDNNDDDDKSKKNVARKSVINSFITDKRFAELFVKPYPDAVEEESLPQTVQEFEAQKWLKPKNNDHNVIYVVTIDSYYHESGKKRNQTEMRKSDSASGQDQEQKQGIKKKEGEGDEEETKNSEKTSLLQV
ncbi:U4/U6.U5 small nuclear ribonucleoprotein component, partial [Reticulomyxa filosa]